MKMYQNEKKNMQQKVVRIVTLVHRCLSSPSSSIGLTVQSTRSTHSTEPSSMSPGRIAMCNNPDAHAKVFVHFYFNFCKTFTKTYEGREHSILYD